MTFAELIEAYIAQLHMEHLRTYLERGRRFAGLTTDALNAAWVDAYHAAFGRRDETREQEFVDLGCEFDLRGLEPPTHLVAAESEEFRERFEREVREGPIDLDAVERCEDELEKLHEQLQAPKN